MKNKLGYLLRLGVALCAASLFVAAPALAESVQEDPLDRAVINIARDLRCAVCQNQPVSESNADLAKDMRQIIREQLQAGKSRDEIIKYFVDRYGDYVLMKPPTDSVGIWVWIGPPAVLAVLVFLAWVFLRKRTHMPITPTPPLSKSDLDRVRAERLAIDPEAARVSKKSQAKKSRKKKE